MAGDFHEPNPVWRVRPIFISSTFRDMHAERDYLATHVMPELAERLFDLRLHLETIDLRLGIETSSITEEMKKQLMVLKVCLTEIERSRPFMIVLLGDRYGWIPPLRRVHTAVGEAGFETDTRGKSITALEIEFGVLSNAEQSKRSFFYFRDPLPYEEMSREKAVIYNEEYSGETKAQDAAGKLKALKARILKEYPDQVRYYSTTWNGTEVSGLDNFGRQVVNDLFNGILADAREAAKCCPPSGLEEYIEQCARNFVGRENILNDLTTLALSITQEGNAWGVCLTGEAGSGKSAVFARLCQKLSKEDVMLLAHAAGISPHSTSVEEMLRGWVGELARALGESNPMKDFEDNAFTMNTEELPINRSKTPDVVEIFSDLLRRTSERRRVVVIIDALDQFERTTRARHLTWLTIPWPQNVRMIVTTIPGEESEAFDELAGGEIMELPALTNKEGEAIATEVYRRYHRSPNPDVLRILLKKNLPKRPAAGNPLWLHLAVEELNLLDIDDFARADRMFTGTFEERMIAMVLDLAQRLPPSVEGLYRWMLDRSEKIHGTTLIRALANLIALSRKGLRETDLRVLIPKVSGEPWNELRFANLRRSFRGHLVLRGDQGQWDFIHSQLRSCILRWNLADAAQKRQLHALISDHLESLPLSDNLRGSELMFHYFHGGLSTRAAEYFVGLHGGETALAEAGLQDIGLYKTPVVIGLRDLIMEGESETPNCKLDWVLSWHLEDDLPFGLHHLLYVRLLWGLHRCLEDRASLNTRRGLLEGIQKGLVALLEKEPDNPSMVTTLADCKAVLANVLAAQGEVEPALACYRAALLNAERLAKQKSNDTSVQLALIGNREGIANLLHAQGKLDEALANYRENVALARCITTEPTPDARILRSLSVNLNKMGGLLIEQGKMDAAEDCFQMALDIRQLRYDPSSTGTNEKLDLAGSYIKKGRAMLLKFNGAGALSALQIALAKARELATENPEHNDYQRLLSVCHSLTGDSLLMMKRLKEAQQAYHADLSIIQRLADKDPTNIEWQKGLAIANEHLGHLLLEMKDPDAALKVQLKALDVRRRMVKFDTDHIEIHAHVAASLNALGEVLITLEQFQQAAEAYREASETFEQVCAAAPDNFSWQRALCLSRNGLANALMMQGMWNEALQEYSASFAVGQKLVDKEPNNKNWIRKMTELRQQVDRLRHSKRVNRTPDVVAIPKYSPDQKELEKQHQIAVGCGKRGDSFYEEGKTEQAKAEYTKSHTMLEKLSKATGPNPVWVWDLSVCKFRIGTLFLKNRQFSEALEELQAALALKEKVLRQDQENLNWQSDMSSTYVKIGDTYNAMGEWNNALGSYQAALPIREHLASLKPPQQDWNRDLAVAYYKVGEMNNKLGDFEEEMNYLRQCHSVLRRMCDESMALDLQARRILSILDNFFGY